MQDTIEHPAEIVPVPAAAREGTNCTLEQYTAMYRDEMGGSLIAAIAALAQQCCDFSRPFQTGDGDATPA